MKRHFIIILLCIIVPFAARAQVAVERSTSIVKIGAKEYYMHHVKQGETLYGLSRAYNVTVDEITRKNPEVLDGLQTGMVIGIPVVQPDNGAVTEQGTESAQQKPAVQIGEGRTYTVKAGETLYDIAKKFGIDLVDFKAVNRGLGNYPSVGTVIQVPDIRNEEAYIIHTVEERRKTSAFIRNWDVDAKAFHAMNPAVGTEVFANQKILIPIEKVVVDEPVVVLDDDTILSHDTIEVEGQTQLDEEINEVPCEVMPENALQRYKVALLIPLYLNDVGKVSVSRDNIDNVRKSKDLLFVQFYEGFMLAVDSLSAHHGLKLDLTVIDVTENENTARAALRQMEQSDYDMIVGPFYSKSFNVVQSYAKDNGILIVNPLSNRENILKDNPYVVKMQPNEEGKLLQLAGLINQEYRNSNVFIVGKSNSTAKESERAMLIDSLVRMSINSEVAVSASEFLEYAVREGRRRQMGSQVPATVDVEGRIYSTRELKNGTSDTTRLDNKVARFVYSQSDMKLLKAELSPVRNNLVIAIDNDNVFATQLLNYLNKQADRYPITLLALKDWTSLEKLSVESLLKLNAVYFSDLFVDYNTEEASRFVSRFRKKYTVEPADYAFVGFDIAWYFLNAMMRYGHDMKDCLPSFEMTTLSTPVRLMRTGNGNGLENNRWNLYQYDKDSIELKAIAVPNPKH